ncbi:MAG: ABC transporter ATP-binding protein, partial [Metamycoplasmataceae bacterium]
MIKQLIFKSNKSLIGDPLVINFDEHVNIIIGPKGGGKSTLFDLLAGLENGYISKNAIDALDTYGLTFEKAIKYNNEIINATQLAKKSKKEMENDFEKRYDVIFQDDPIKKNINNLDQIDKQKKDYAQNLIDKSPVVLELIKKIENFYNGMMKISEMNNQNEINWTNAFQIKPSTDSKTKLIINLNYNNTDINQKVNIERRNLNIVIENSKKQIVELEKFKTLNFNGIDNDETFIM